MRLARLLAVLLLASVPAFAQDEEAAEALAAEPAAGEATAPAGGDGGVVPLAEALAQLATDPLFTTAAVSVQVQDLESGAVVWQYGDDAPRIPASTMKLVTTAVALRTLGPSFRFPTWILTDGKLGADGLLDGNLYVKGQGDPTMVVERMWRLVADLRLRGVREIKGSVVFDEGYFADTTLVPGWNNPDDLEEGPTYFAPLGALSVNYNVATLLVRPGAGYGQPAVVEVDTPTSAVVVVNKVTTGSTRSRKWFRVERTLDEAGKVATFEVSGNIPSDEAPVSLYRAIADPLGNYMGAMQTVMRQHGIKVRGTWKAGTTPKDAELFHTVRSDTLTEILAAMDKQSNNFIAEQVLRSVGAETYGLPGTTEKGLQAVRAYFSELGIPEGDYQLSNGSGLSRQLLLRPSHLNAVLRDMHADPDVGPEFLTALAVGGRDGTLWSRFRDDGLAGRVRGKTGSLNGVHCLSGYVEARDGRDYAFSFLVNDIEGATSRARRAHDRLVLALAGGAGNVADSRDAEEP